MNRGPQQRFQPQPQREVMIPYLQQRPQIQPSRQMQQFPRGNQGGGGGFGGMGGGGGGGRPNTAPDWMNR